MRRPFDLSGPSNVVGGVALAASVAIHVALLVVLLVLPRMTYEEVRFIELAPVDSQPRQVVLPSLGRLAPPADPGGDSGGGGGGRGARRVAQAPPDVEPPVVEVPVTPPQEAVSAPVARAGADSVAAAVEGLGDDSVPTAPTPRLGEGSLWVRPLALAALPEDVREAILGDPAARLRMQAIFDSVQAEPGAQRSLPGWAVEIPGVGRVGIDSASIQVGPIKIPAAVLALLPFPQGNIDEARRAAMLAEMRADIMRAAQRAATVDEFKARVRAIRQRKEEEREAERGRKVARDTIKP